jgi:SRSO17 transposase
MAYVGAVTSVLGHAGRRVPCRWYCAGLLLPGARKSVEPMAARMEPGRVQAAHQSLHYVVAQSEWSDDAVLGAVRALIVDDTATPKNGTHSVGVARQSCGQLGKQEACQVAVTLSVANDHASLPIAHRLYLPREWAEEPDRRARAGVPEEMVLQTKPQIALGQLRAALEAGVTAPAVLADAAYGTDTDFRDGITALGLPDVVGSQSSTSLWPPGAEPLPPKRWRGRGRPPSLIRRDAEHQPVPAKAIALALPKLAWRRLTRREATHAPLVSRCAAVRVRPAHRDDHRATVRPEEGCLIEWPVGEPEPTKYWLSTLPANTTRRTLVDTAKLRWRIERDHQALKQELGLGHYEGRGWRGFHHHATLCIAAYGFLIAEREAIPPGRPQGPAHRSTSPTPRLPTPRRPRSDLSAMSRTPSPPCASRSPAPARAP